MKSVFSQGVPAIPALPSWLSTPVYPTERATARSRALWSVGWSTLGVAAVYLTAMMFFEPESAARRAGTLGGLAVIAVGTHWANRRGYLEIASWAFLALLLAFFTQRAWITGGIHAPIVPLYLIIIMMGGVVLGGRGAWVTAGGSVVGAALLAAGELAGRLEPWQAFASPLAMFAFLSIIVGLTVVLQRMVTSAFRASLRRAEAAIAEHERTQTRRTLALEAGQVVAWELDPATGLVRADEGVFKLFDLDGDADTPFDVARIVERIHTDDLPAFAERVRRRTDHADDQSPRPRLQFRIVRRDGSIRHAESASVVLPAADGHPSVVSGVTVDITHRRQAELERERLLHNLGERVKELRLLHHVAQATQRTATTHVDLLNDVAAMLPEAWQYPEVAVARATFGDIVAKSPGWRVCEWAQSTDFISGGRAGSLTVGYTERRPTADEGPFLSEERALLDSVAEMLVAHLDSMRSRQELEELVTTRTSELRSARDSAESARQSLAENLARLQELEHLRDDLVKMIVHDMRGLLLVVTANLELARQEVAGQPLADIDDAMSAANEVSRMANTLLDVSRLEEGKMPMTLDAHDIADLLSAATTTLGPLAADHAIAVVATGPVVARCDRELTRRVVDNLIGNALKHTPAGSAIRLEAQRQGDRVRVSVVDSGLGIPPELQDRVFEKFRSAKDRASSAHHSAGLGLAFCKLAVEAHGGQIWVESAAPTGTAFRFELPAA